MTKRFVLVSIILIAAMVFMFGCGGKDESKTDVKDTFKVALLLPGTVDDQGWNALAYEGLKRIESELGAEIAFMEQVAPSDIEQVFRGYALEGYDLIYGHGFEFGDGAMKVAQDFPDIKFIVTSTTIYQSPNVASLQNNNQETGFLAGVMAGLLTESNYVGSIAGMEIPSISDFQEGFAKGVKYVNKDARAVTTFIGNFDDAATAKEMALSMISQGADVLTHAANQAGLGVIEAGRENNVYTIGSYGDQSALSPDTIVVSILNDMAEAMVVSAKKTLEGNFEAKHYLLGVAEGSVGLSSFHGWEKKLDQEIIDKVKEIETKLANKEIDVLSLPK